jgi:hypothetical protein
MESSFALESAALPSADMAIFFAIRRRPGGSAKAGGISYSTRTGLSTGSLDAPRQAWRRLDRSGTRGFESCIVTPERFDVIA